MRNHLRRFTVALAESAVVLVMMLALYILGYLLCYHELPRWK